MGQWSRQAGGGTRGGEIRPEAGRGGEPDGMASISGEHGPSNTDHGGVRGTPGKRAEEVQGPTGRYAEAAGRDDGAPKESGVARRRARWPVVPSRGR